MERSASWLGTCVDSEAPPTGRAAKELRDQAGIAATAAKCHSRSHPTLGAEHRSLSRSVSRLRHESDMVEARPSTAAAAAATTGTLFKLQAQLNAARWSVERERRAMEETRHRAAELTMKSEPDAREARDAAALRARAAAHAARRCEVAAEADAAHAAAATREMMLARLDAQTRKRRAASEEQAKALKAARADQHAATIALNEGKRANRDAAHLVNAARAELERYRACWRDALARAERRLAAVTNASPRPARR